MSDGSDESDTSRQTRPADRQVVRRSSQLRSKPISTMPPSQSGGGEHAIYTQIASLQVAKARQQKIRDSLLDQVAQCDEAIARAEDEIRELMNRAGIGELPDRPANSAPGADGPEAEESDRRETDEFHYQY